MAQLGSLSVISVIVRTTSSFDAALVKPGTTTLGDGSGTDASVAKHNGAPIATLVDVDKDGDKDLVLAFRKADLVAAGDLTAATTNLVSGPSSPMAAPRGRGRGGGDPTAPEAFVATETQPVSPHAGG